MQQQTRNRSLSGQFNGMSDVQCTLARRNAFVWFALGGFICVESYLGGHKLKDLQLYALVKFLLFPADWDRNNR